MFDTCALNQLNDSDNGIRLIVESLQRGFEYYLADIQKQEAKNNILPNKDRFSDVQVVERTRAERALALLESMIYMRPISASQYATLLQGGWPLDGSRDILPDDEEQAVEMFEDIRNDNPEHHNDAMIALVAIANGCTVVTNDKRFFRKVNAHFPGRAIKYADFIALLMGQ